MTAHRRACRTGKKSWRSEEQAKLAIRSIRTEVDDPDAVIPNRAYLCEFCHRYHLTSRDERPVENIPQR